MHVVQNLKCLLVYVFFTQISLYVTQIPSGIKPVELIKMMFEYSYCRDCTGPNFHPAKSLSPKNFIYNLENVLKRTPFVLSGHFVSYWGCFFIGSAYGLVQAKVYDEDFEISFSVDHGLEKFDESSVGVILALKKTNEEGQDEIAYNGIYITKEKNAAKDQEIIKSMEVKMQKNYESFQGVNMRESHIIKINIGKVENTEMLKIITLANKDGFSEIVKAAASVASEDSFKPIRAEDISSWNTMKDKTFKYKDGQFSLDDLNKENANPNNANPNNANPNNEVTEIYGDEPLPIVHDILDKYPVGMDTSEDRKIAMKCVHDMFAIISNTFMSFQEGKKFWENFYHGFIHGYLEFNFAKRFYIDVNTEKRGGRGFIDLAILIHKEAGRNRNTMLTLVELKKEDGTGLEALLQIYEKGYAYLPPNVRTKSEHAALIGIAPKKDGKTEINAVLTKSKDIPDQNFAETFVSELKEIGEIENADTSELREKIYEAFSYLFYSSYNGNDVHYLTLTILGQLIALPLYSELKVKQKFVFRDPGDPWKFVFVVTFEDETRPIALIIERAEKQSTRQKEELEELLGKFPANMEQYLTDYEAINTVTFKLMSSDKEILEDFLSKEDKNYLLFDTIKEIEYHAGGNSATLLNTVDSENILALFRESKDKRIYSLRTSTMTKIQPKIEEAFRGINPLIETELDFHAVLEGIFNGQHSYQTFCEAGSGSGKIDIFLKSKNNEQSHIIIELKHTSSIETYDLIRSASEQVKRYVDTFGRSIDSESVIAATMVYVENARRHNNPRAIKVNSVVSEVPLTPLPKQQRCSRVVKKPHPTKRTKRSLLCWEDVIYSEDNTENEEKLTSKVEDGYQIDNEELVKFMKFKDKETQVKAVELYKKMKHPNSEITEMGCGNKLPTECVDRDTIDLVDKESSHEIIENLKSKYPNSLMSNALRWGAALSHKLNSGLMAYNFIEHVDEAIREKNYEPMLVDTGFYVIEYSEQIHMVGKKILESKLADYLTIRLAEAALVDKVMPNAIKNGITRTVLKCSKFMNTKAIKAVKVLPFAVMNAAGIVTSSAEIYENMKILDEAEGYEKANAIIAIAENSCDLATYMISSALMVTGQVELEPIVMLVQILCDVSGTIGHRYIKMKMINEDVELSLKEKLLMYVPWKTESIQNVEVDQEIHKIYQNLLVNNANLQYFDYIVTTLYDIKLEKADERLSDDEIAISDFVGNRRFNLTSEISYFLKLPNNTIVKIRNSLKNETAFTNELSRTLVMLKEMNKVEYTVVCGPTGEDAKKDDTDGLYSILNKDGQNDDLNYCDHAIGIGKVDNSRAYDRPTVFYDISARNDSHLEAGDNINFIMFNERFNVRGGSFKNIVVLKTKFIAEKINFSLSSSNEIILNGYNFTEKNALSKTGARVTSLVGTHGVPQILYAGKMTNNLEGGRNNYINAKYSQSNYLRLKVMEKSTWNMETFEGHHLDLDIFDNENFEDGDYAEVFLPIIGFDVENELLVSIFYNSSRKNDDKILDPYYDFEHHKNELRIVKAYVYGKRIILCKVHTNCFVKRLHVNINSNFRQYVFFEKGVIPPYAIDIFHDISKAESMYEYNLRDMLSYAEEILPHNSRYYGHNSDVDVIIHNKKTYIDFAVNGEALMLFYPRAVYKSLIFIEKLNPAEIVVRHLYPYMTDELIFVVYIKQESSMPLNYTAYRRWTHSLRLGAITYDDLEITYYYNKTENNTIKFSGFFSPLLKQSPEVHLHIGNKFYDRIVPNDVGNFTITKYQRSKIHKVVLLSEFISIFKVEDLFAVSTLCFPGVYTKTELKSLKHKNVLIVFHEKTKRILYFHNYDRYSDELLNIRMIFRNGHARIGDFIKNSEYFVDHINQQDKIFLHKVIDDDEVSFIEVNNHFEIHLSDAPHPCVLVIRDDLRTVSISFDSDNQVLLIKFLKGEIKIYDWEENPNVRPLFLFGGTIFDITEYSISQVDKMAESVTHKEEMSNIELF